MITADIPVKSQNQDRCGRYNTASQFAEIIIRYFINHKDKNCPSIVYGIQGDWGEGKTSFLNFIKEALKKRISVSSFLNTDSVRYTFFENFLKERISEVEGPTYFEIIDFCSWSCFSFGQLVSQFFLQIQEVLANYDGFKKIESDLIQYASAVVSVGGELPKIGWIFSMFEKLLNINQIKSLASIKERISDFLVVHKIYLVIAIDDSDRLVPDNLLIFLQFITTIVDFPNTAFLLAYSRKYFSTVLTKSFNENKEMAAIFLEKVIDVHFDLPVLSPGLLRHELAIWLNEYCNDFHIDIVQRITDNSFLDKISGWLTNFRQLNHLMNKLVICRWQFNKRLDPQDVFVFNMLQILFPDDSKIIFKDYSTFMDYLSKTESNDLWERVSNQEEIKSILQMFFSNQLSYGHLEKRIIDKSYFNYYFLSEEVKVLDEIEMFVGLCLKDASGEQIQKFFSLTIIDIFKFRSQIKQYFASRTKGKQRQAIACLKSLIRHFDIFDPPDSSSGVYEQNSASLVKFDYAMSFLQCIEKATRVQHVRNIFASEKLDVVLYFFQNIFLNSAFNYTYGKQENDRIEPILNNNDKSKILRVLIDRLKIERKDLIDNEDIWFSPCFLQLADMEEIKLKQVENSNNNPIGNCKKIIIELFIQWDCININESFFHMIKPFIPKAKSGKYYFIRADQYKTYVRLYKQGRSDSNLKDSLIELGQKYRKNIEMRIRILAGSNNLHDQEQARRFVCLILYSEMSSQRRDGVMFSGISATEVINQMEKIQNRR